MGSFLRLDHSKLLLIAFFWWLSFATIHVVVLAQQNSPAFPFDLSRVRSFDGSDRDDHWGKAGEALARIVSTPNYPGDGTGNTVIAMTPNARSISNTVCRQDDEVGGLILSDRSLSAMIWTFGQLLDHDMGLTDSAGSNGRVKMDLQDGSTDIFVGQAGCSFMEMMRSDFAGSPRQQVRLFLWKINCISLVGSC